jgi:hypothetical protein
MTTRLIWTHNPIVSSRFRVRKQNAHVNRQRFFFSLVLSPEVLLFLPLDPFVMDYHYHLTTALRDEDKSKATSSRIQDDIHSFRMPLDC